MKDMIEALDGMAVKYDLNALQTRVSRWMSRGAILGLAITTSSPALDTTAVERYCQSHGYRSRTMCRVGYAVEQQRFDVRMLWGDLGQRSQKHEGMGDSEPPFRGVGYSLRRPFDPLWSP